MRIPHRERKARRALRGLGNEIISLLIDSFCADIVLALLAWKTDVTETRGNRDYKLHE